MFCSTDALRVARGMLGTPVLKHLHVSAASRSLGACYCALERLLNQISKDTSTQDSNESALEDTRLIDLKLR